MHFPFVTREAYARVLDSSQALQDQLRALRAQLDSLSDLLRLTTEAREAAQKEALHSKEVIADWLAMRSFGHPIYGVAPALPEEPLPSAATEAAFQRRPNARDVAERLTREFYAQYESRGANS